MKKQREMMPQGLPSTWKDDEMMKVMMEEKASEDSAVGVTEVTATGGLCSSSPAGVWGTQTMGKVQQGLEGIHWSAEA